MVAEHGFDLLALVHAQQAVIDENAGELVADCLVNQDGGDRAVDPARQAADDAPVTHLRTDFGHLGLAVGGHRPVALQPADAVDEIGEQFRPIGRVDDFGVELRAVKLPRLVRDHGKGRAVGYRHDLETGGELRHLVAVAHPYLVAFAHIPQAIEQRALLGDGEVGTAKFAAFPGFVAGAHFAAQLVAHHLLAIADAKDRHACSKQHFGRARAAFVGHAGGRAGQDDAFGAHPVERGFGHAERGNLAIDARFPHAACDQLGHLAAEIDDEDGIGVFAHGTRACLEARALSSRGAFAPV